MASELLLSGSDSAAEDRRSLDDHDELVLAPVLRELVLYTAKPEDAAVVHVRRGEVISAWDREGALRLAQALPPAYADLAERLVRRHEGGRSTES